MTHKPTEAEIEAARTKNGGWTRETLAGWGVPWPPPQGWRQALLADDPAKRMSAALDAFTRAALDLSENWHHPTWEAAASKAGNPWPFTLSFDEFAYELVPWRDAVRQVAAKQQEGDKP